MLKVYRMKKLDIGIIGLAVMGRSLALNMADHGFMVGGYNRSREVTDTLIQDHPHENFTPYYDLKEMVGALAAPRKIMLMIQAGKPVDLVIEQLIPLLQPGDIIMDGGNSFFEDTRRRYTLLEEKGIHYYGVGISGGEKGARFGPSIMPGGNRDTYDEIKPVLEAIAARAKGEPCCSYMGPDGAGHYVKMVHNGIEYADMQLIAESYLLLKHAGGYDNQAIGDIFAQWNQGELQSYLIGITADIFHEKDDFQEGELLDYILDSAQQKGTGRWASIEALKQGVDISMITAACNARIMSNRIEERKEAGERLHVPSVSASKQHDEYFGEIVREGLYAAKIAAYAQGFSMLKDASSLYDWNLDFGNIAAIFRAGCIIQAEFLNDITLAFRKNPQLDNLILDDFFLSRIDHNLKSLRTAVITGINNGIPMPAMANALSYIDAFRGDAVGANLIQAQRDCFGAHTYKRIDRDGSFHHDWGKLS